MADVYQYGHGLTTKWTNSTGSAVVAGQGVLVGLLVGIAIDDIADTEEGEVSLEGEWMVAKDANAIGQGAAVNMTAAGVFQTAAAGAGGIDDCGVCTVAALAGDSHAVVLLNRKVGTAGV